MKSYLCEREEKIPVGMDYLVYINLYLVRLKTWEEYIWMKNFALVCTLKSICSREEQSKTTIKFI